MMKRRRGQLPAVGHDKKEEGQLLAVEHDDKEGEGGYRFSCN